MILLKFFCNTLESVTSMTSDGSGVEERIKLLKQQLQQKKEEMKKFQNEQKRKKKAILRQQEEQLKRKLEVSTDLGLCTLMHVHGS